MTDTLLPPSSGFLTPATPSGLTPNTRSEAEAALTLNTLTQTESAAPATPLATDESFAPLSEAQKAYRRPGTARASSTNYEAALRSAHSEESTGSTVSAVTEANEVGVAGAPFPRPGEGVVPLNPGVGTGVADGLKKVRPSGLSLGMLGRQQSWSEQDMKHVYTANLLKKVEGDPGYSSGNEGVSS